MTTFAGSSMPNARPLHALVSRRTSTVQASWTARAHDLSQIQGLTSSEAGERCAFAEATYRVPEGHGTRLVDGASTGDSYGCLWLVRDHVDGLCTAGSGSLVVARPGAPVD